MAALRKKEEAKAQMEKCHLLLEEFKLGIYTREEYRAKAAELDGEKDGLSARAESPPWDAEDTGLLASDDEAFL